MPSISSRSSGVPAVGELIVLTDERAHSRVELSPTRGALVTSFQVAGRELLYLDAGTLADPQKNVRGGIPVLFPSPGKLVSDQFTRHGKHGAMKQHGFARELRWDVERRTDPGVTLALRSSPATLTQFPFAFVYQLTFTLEGPRVTLGMRVENTGQDVLPFGLGFHPYFLVPDAQKASARIETKTTRVFDNVSKQERAFAGFDFAAEEQDLYLLDHASDACVLTLPDGARITVRGTPAFSTWVVWAVAGKDYICVEPWTARPDALNTGASLIELPPGGTREEQVVIEYGT